MSEIQLLHGRTDVREALRDTDELALFRYNLNIPTFLITLIVGSALTGLGGVIWWKGQLGTGGYTVTFGVLVGLGLALGGLAAYWYSYTQTHFLAATPEHLFVGTRDRMWAISWELLDREALGLEEMNVSSVGGQLELNVAEHQIPVRLFNPFVMLDHLEAFMGRLLEQAKSQDDTD